jgi:hypothetical protein
MVGIAARLERLLDLRQRLFGHGEIAPDWPKRV